ncbi:hypothetical protein C8J57DRAFT_1298012, partial [Mycena rebaudengoi]
SSTTFAPSSTSLSPISEIDDSNEAAVNQLLRSSSARYAVASAVDYSSLPPLPHPINQVLQTPASSTVSLASSSINSTTRGTYTVKVHRRKHHALTEFPNANRADDGDRSMPNESNNRLLGLRSDPSVASLLDLYDEHGRLPSRAFSNSPPSDREGRAQVQRSGSTLRQLLGNPSASLNSRGESSALEGDISWAERFLGAYGPPHPHRIPDSHLPETPLQTNLDHSFITDNDFSSENPAISSLEVELSDIAETPPRNSPYMAADPQTPQRASQVFGFLTDKRRSRAVEDEEQERSLPQIPSAFSSPSSEGSPTQHHSHFSSDGSADSIVPPLPVTPIESQFESVDTHSNPAENLPVKTNDVHVIMAHGPTKVIVTAPTPSFHHDNVAPPRLPRGPRQLRTERPRDVFTTIPTRRRASGQTAEKPSSKPRRRLSILAVFEKENHLSAKPELPRTPIRTGSISRPYQQQRRAPASPATSLELSAAGQQLMLDLRQQRTRAREVERARGPRTYV